MSKYLVQANDGAFHGYPEGFTMVINGDWVEIRDEHDLFVAAFFRPIYVMKQ